MISINNNLMAADVADMLTSHYGRLSTSIERLSSGLRINGAADDAAGLAIREMMRADIAALHQGVRNANDAISMIQTFDGALSVIDEKLIRMKELAEQAATGTYNSTQRLMIDSEFQAMASEIDRIANATDFNGVKLLCTKMMTWYTDEQRFVVTNPGSVDNLQFSAANNARPTLNINAGNYINANNPTETIRISLEAEKGTEATNPPGNLNVISQNGGRTEYGLDDTDYKIAYVDALSGSANTDGLEIKYSSGSNPPWSITNATTGQSYVTAYSPLGSTILNGEMYDMSQNPPIRTESVSFSMMYNNNTVDLQNIDPDIVSIEIDTKNNTYVITRNKIIFADKPDYTASYDKNTQTVTVNLTKGGTATLKLDNALNVGDTINFEINLEGEIKTVPVEHHGVDPNQKVKIHFGPGNDSAEDYYYIKYTNCTKEGLGLADVDIQTQQNAQEALITIDEAIVEKDKIRAYLGATQNRLENTITNLTTQSENLQAAESRISDSDIAREMTEFVRNQVLTNSAVAMLAQANSMPQMVLRLIGA